MKGGTAMIKEEIDISLAQLTEGVKSIFQSEEYLKYLTIMSKFHTYSYNNVLLILMQRPDATMVAGFQAWRKKFHRVVRRGERGIKIFAPVVKRDGEKDCLVCFKTTTVFDISQTDGEPLPSFVKNLEFRVENFSYLFNALLEISPVPVELKNLNQKANGYYSYETCSIAVECTLSEAQIIKTLIHEISHAILHDRSLGKDREVSIEVKEVEAESIAFVVCNYLGIDTSDYSFGYIAGWSTNKDLSEMKDVLKVIQETAKDIISLLDNALEESKLESGK